MGDQPASLAAALVQLQGRLPAITKTATGQYGKYADLHVITDAIAPLLAELALLWICLPTLLDGQFVLHYYMQHGPSGETSLEGFYPLTIADAQKMGSQITYARRYALCAALNIAPAGEDDDGQAATDAWRPPANPRTRKADRHNARRNGPLPDDEWTTGYVPNPEPGTITERQRPRLMAAFNRAKITAREDRLAYAMSKLDLPELATSNDLSEEQAGELIAHLEAEVQD